MDADNLSELNADKAAAQIALWPATVKFQKTGDTEYSCSFGETLNAAILHESGQGVQNHRLGWLYFPFTAAFTPSRGQTFTVLTSNQAAIVGKRFRVEEPASGPGEPVVRLRCSRIEN